MEALADADFVVKLANLKLGMEEAVAGAIKSYSDSGGAIATVTGKLEGLGNQAERLMNLLQRVAEANFPEVGLPGARGTIEQLGQEAVNDYWRRRTQPSKSP